VPGDLQNRDASKLTRLGDERALIFATLRDGADVMVEELWGASGHSRTWQSLFTGRIVPARWVAEVVRPRSDVPAESKRYGLGFWLGQHSDTVILEGFDAGVSFRSVHDPRSAITCTVISNSSEGAWPIARRLDESLAG
jgi:hypothetical protein